MAMDVENRAPLGFPYWNPVRRRFAPDAPFFDSGNIERELLAKQVALDITEDDKQQLQIMDDGENREVFCPIVGCGARLNSLDGFEDHYNARHMASCSVCSRVYPTSRLLSIHVAESHDSFFQAKVARGFAMARPSKKQRQKHQRKLPVHKGEEASNAMQVEEETIDDLVSAVSKLRTSDTTPSAISFGHRHTRGFHLFLELCNVKRPDSSSAAKEK
ncbi:unnamed protein product [Thlaspi arvense]|uniref:C2H2-type domain-containing protein n=1 Tax=Thlaspi arvense TaxID=13288 RepID=A0AAU9RX12_THLAR|nr:unnamed protein product [Thlaspi arvense]